jgi:hypothetical protein
MSDEQEEPIQEQGAEAAFEAAKQGFELFGKPLKPYSPSRKVAAQSMGLMYPYIGEERAAIFEDTGMYPGMLTDAIILLWLCTLPDQRTPSDKWTPDAAAKKPGAAKIAATFWATAAGMVETMSKEFQEAQQVFMAIVSGVEASKFKLNIPGAEQAEDDSPKV